MNEADAWATSSPGLRRAAEWQQISGGSFLAGAVYAGASVWAGGRIPSGAGLLILFAALAFLTGLVSAQIVSRRFGGVSRS